MMTGVVNSKELGQQFANFGRALLRQIFVDRTHDELAEMAVQRFAQEAKQIRRGNEDNAFELRVNASAFEATGYFASKFGGLLIACGVGIAEGMSVRGTPRSVARQIALMRARFRVHKIFEFLQRTPGCCDGEDARA
jgi:hypothetical protein